MGNDSVKNNGSISLRELLQILWENIIWIVSITVVTTICAIVLAVAVIKPTYKSSTSILVNPEKFQSSSTSADVAGGLRATATVADWMIEDSIIFDTIKKLEAEGVVSKGTFTLKAFKNNISVKTSTTTLFITLSFTYIDADIAQEALNSLVEVGLDKSQNYVTMKDSYDQVTLAAKGIYAGPNKKLYTIIGFAGGLVLSIILIFLKDLLKNKMKTEEDVEDNLGLKVIGVQIKEKNEEVIDINNDGINKDNIESLLMNIDFSNVDAKYKVIEFTSTRESEGKSTTVLQLAKAMANLKRKCIVIDMDLRKPVQHRLFKLEKNVGVSEYITGKANSKKEVIKNVNEYVDVITAGTKAPNPALILTSEKFKTLIDELREDYEYIFLDCPPIYAGSDAKLISNVSDCLVYVVAANYTKIAMAKHAVSELSDIDTNIMGCAMTMVKRQNAKYKSYYYYKYYSEEEKSKK